jgi:hypothetical protein
MGRIQRPLTPAASGPIITLFEAQCETPARSMSRSSWDWMARLKSDGKKGRRRGRRADQALVGGDS